MADLEVTSKPSSGTFDWLSENPIVSLLNDSYTSFSTRREQLGLTNPGTVENVSAEVTKGVFLNNHAFTGLRAELTKGFSMSPLFQVSHSFSMGLGGPGGMPPYNFSAIFGTNKIFCQANVDNEGSLNARFNYRLNSAMITRVNTQVAPGQAMLQLDQDFVGRDFHAKVQAYNPSYLDSGLTGIFIGSYLQSITRSLSAGIEAVWQRPAVSQPPESALSYVARYVGSDWVASAQLQGQGAVQATYYKKVGERVEAGVESQLTLGAPTRGGGGMMGGGMRKEGLTTIGAKYDFRNSTMRAQVDTTGKLSCLLEKRVAPLVTLTFSGEMDHFKNQAKVGLSVSIENAGDEGMEQQPQSAPSIPF